MDNFNKIIEKYNDITEYNNDITEYNYDIQLYPIELELINKNPLKNKIENDEIEIQNNLKIYNLNINKIDDYNNNVSRYNTEIFKNDNIIKNENIDKICIQIQIKKINDLTDNDKIKKYNKYILDLKTYNDIILVYNNNIKNKINKITDEEGFIDTRSKNPTNKLIFLNYLYNLYIFLLKIKNSSNYDLKQKKIQLEIYFLKINIFLNYINNLYEVLYKYNFNTIKTPSILIDKPLTRTYHDRTNITTGYYILSDINYYKKNPDVSDDKKNPDVSDDKNFLYLSKYGFFTHSPYTIILGDKDLKLLEIDLNNLSFKDYISIRTFKKDDLNKYDIKDVLIFGGDNKKILKYIKYLYKFDLDKLRNIANNKKIKITLKLTKKQIINKLLKFKFS